MSEGALGSGLCVEVWCRGEGTWRYRPPAFNVPSPVERSSGCRSPCQLLFVVVEWPTDAPVR